MAVTIVPNSAKISFIDKPVAILPKLRRDVKKPIDIAVATLSSGVTALGEVVLER